MSTPDIHQKRIDHINLLTLGDRRNPPLVLIHGIRDVSWSLIPVAAVFSDNYFVVIPDLRGHGDSEKPGNYAIHQFIFDLENLLRQLNLGPVNLFGHSLGGHIVIRTAALYPELVQRLIVVEGLGPPERPGEASQQSDFRHYADRLHRSMRLHRRLRPLPSAEFAAERILANNPRISPEFARWLVEHSTEWVEGELHWKFDARVEQLWLSNENPDSREYYRQVQCPTLVVNADLAHEYWTRQISIPGWSGRYSDAELKRKVSSFPNAELVHMKHAGHMTHYDAPMDLAREMQSFFDSSNLGSL